MEFPQMDRKRIQQKAHVHSFSLIKSVSENIASLPL
jgi:hypothetical protein